MAPGSGIGPGVFLAASVPIRAFRFVVAVLVADGLNRLFAARLTAGLRLAILATAWLLFYVTYFALMPN